MTFVRSIDFTVPGTSAAPSVNLKAFEDGAGNLVFTIDVLEGAKTADLRGLFFDVSNEGKLQGLSYTGGGGLITGIQARANQVIDLGEGNNMQGSRSGAFDVGLAFGDEGIGRGKSDINAPVTFTLSNTAGNLNLDDIAQTLFGVREASVGSPTSARNDSAKLTFVAPAAPDAKADSYTIFEDGRSSLNDPSHVPLPVRFNVLTNDTDADGNKLNLTEVENGLHGTTQIVKDAAGDYILYTPKADYAGADSFRYAITDNNGGTDFATVAVTVTPVADVPTLTYTVAAGALVNQIKVTVTATQTDDDSSEYIDRIDLSGLPSGVTVSELAWDPATTTPSLVHEFLLTLPVNTDINFNLGMTATSKETSGGDTQTVSDTLAIVLESTFTKQDVTFVAQDQNLWDSGTAFTFTDDRFVGINQSLAGGFSIDDLAVSSTGSIRTGFQSTLQFNGGEIDATAPYDIEVTSNFNKTTNVLTIDSSATLLNGAFFTTAGPGGSYKLDFIFDGDFGLNVTWDGDSIYSKTFFDADVTENILDLDSSDLAFTVGLPLGFSLDFAWPNLLTNSSGDTSNPYAVSGASNNFLGLNLDIDSLIADLLKLPANPFDLTAGIDLLVASGSVTLEMLDVDVGLGLNFLQAFELALGTMGAKIQLENGAMFDYTIGGKLTVPNAKSYDQNNDGSVSYHLILDPLATMKNNTDLGFNFTWNLDVLKGSYEYEILFGLLADGKGSFGPVVDLGGTIPIAAVDIYDKSFALNFASQDLLLVA